MLKTTEAQLNKAFSHHAPVERVKKIRDYAFVHFNLRNGALTAMKAMNGLFFAALPSFLPPPLSLFLSCIFYLLFLKVLCWMMP